MYLLIYFISHFAFWDKTFWMEFETVDVSGWKWRLSHTLNPCHFCFLLAGTWSSRPISAKQTRSCCLHLWFCVCAEAHFLCVSFALNQCGWRHFTNSNWTGLDSGFGTEKPHMVRQWKPYKHVPAKPGLWQQRLRARLILTTGKHPSRVWIYS